MGKSVLVESLHLNRWHGSLPGCPGFQGLCHSMVSAVAVWLWHWRSVVQLARAFFFSFVLITIIISFTEKHDCSCLKMLYTVTVCID